MTIQLLSDSPIFHAMALDVLDPKNEQLPTISPEFVGYPTESAKEMWMGDPHQPKPSEAPKALPATGSIAAITAHGEPDRIDDAAPDDVADAVQVQTEAPITVRVQSESRVIRPGEPDVQTDVIDLVSSTQVFDTPETSIPTGKINLGKRGSVNVRRTTRSPRNGKR
jgi:hypothetical protein